MSARVGFWRLGVEPHLPHKKRAVGALDGDRAVLPNAVEIPPLGTCRVPLVLVDVVYSLIRATEAIAEHIHLGCPQQHRFQREQRIVAITGDPRSQAVERTDRAAGAAPGGDAKQLILQASGPAELGP